MSPRRSVDDDDEEPSPDDLARLGHETAYCPHCGAETWDDAQFCADCGRYFDAASAWPPATVESRRRWRALAVTLVVVGLLAFIWVALL